jgi:putative ABC transport system permease protein
MIKKILSLALRNTKRNRRRSLLALISIATAMLVIVLMQGFLGGVIESLVRNATRTETGHIRITAGSFEAKKKFLPVTENLKNGEALMHTIANAPCADNIDLITERISFPVVLSHEGKTRSAVGIAGDIEKEKRLLELDRAVLPKGRYLAHEREMLIGEKMAAMLGYRLGDTVKVMAQGSDWALHLRKFVVVGIFRTGITTIDKNLFQIGLSDARKLLRMDSASQQILVVLKDYHSSAGIAAQMRREIGDTSVIVTPWTENGFTYQYVKLAGGIYAVIFLCIAFFGAFIIGNIMMMVVMERRHEIGIMKSMGFTPSNIRFLFLSEGIILGGAGSGIGILLGMIIISLVNIHGLDLSAMMAGVEGIAMDMLVNFRISPVNLICIFTLGIGVSALVSALPAKRAAKMNVVDSIRR